MRWTNLEPIIQSEVSQKEKDKYMLTYTYGIQKNGINEFICRAAMEKQTYENRLMDKGGREEGEGEMNRESSMEAYILTYVK